MPEAAQDPRIDELLAGLNPPQRDAVVHGEGPLLILAGAGSGKTRVLTHRIAYLMRTKQARADEILAITFTNKAAQEMRERVELLVGRATRAMWVMTFHSACARMLRADAHRLGYTRQFTIYDAADQRRLIKRCLDDLDIDAKRFTPRAMQSQISDAKNKLRSSEDYRQLVGSYFEQTVADVYEQYERELHRMNAMDFDDLLVRSVNLLELFQEVRDRYSAAFRWILVDEYQDTNHAQYRWLQLLASEHRNLAVVGDDDQCLVEGTPITMGDGSVKPIEEVRAGDEVMSCYGSGDFRPARVTDTHVSERRWGTEITTRWGRRIVSTPEHTHFAGFRREHTPPMHLTYLMWRRDKGFRVGTKIQDGEAKFPVSGVALRAMQENADAAWVHLDDDSEPEARLQETQLSLMFGIPTLPFNARPSAKSPNSVVGDQNRIDRLFSSLDTEQGGRALLRHYGLSFDHPHHIPRGFEGRRRNVTVTCAATAAARRPCISSRSADAIPRCGMRSRRRACRSGRPRRARRAGATSRASRILARRWRSWKDPGCDACIGAGRGAPRPRASCRSFPLRSVRRGMVMFTEDGGYDVVESGGGDPPRPAGLRPEHRAHAQLRRRRPRDP